MLDVRCRWESVADQPTADAHRAGGAADLLLGSFEVVGVEVGHLDLGDLLDVGLGDRGDGALARRAGGLGDAGLLTDQHRASAAS